MLGAKRPPAFHLILAVTQTQSMFFIKKQSTVLQVTFDGMYPDLFPDFRGDIDNPTSGLNTESETDAEAWHSPCLPSTPSAQLPLQVLLITSLGLMWSCVTQAAVGRSCNQLRKGLALQRYSLSCYQREVFLGW